MAPLPGVAPDPAELNHSNVEPLLSAVLKYSLSCAVVTDKFAALRIGLTSSVSPAASEKPCSCAAAAPVYGGHTTAISSPALPKTKVEPASATAHVKLGVVVIE